MFCIWYIKANKFHTTTQFCFYSLWKIWSTIRFGSHTSFAMMTIPQEIQPTSLPNLPGSCIAWSQRDIPQLIDPWCQLEKFLSVDLYDQYRETPIAAFSYVAMVSFLKTQKWVVDYELRYCSYNIYWLHFWFGLTFVESTCNRELLDHEYLA